MEHEINKNDVHEIVVIGGVEVWIGDGAVLNNFVLEMEFPMIHKGAPANIFKSNSGWIAFILDENESEWSLRHCYIPDPKHKLTLKQLLTVLNILRNKILNELKEVEEV